jgi:dTDP-4-dehydrorhamnose reductase
MHKRRVVITGAAGQLGRTFLAMQEPGWDCIGLTSKQLDITRWRDVRDTISRIAPDLIIHAGAATNVDRCEREHSWAFSVNALGSRNVARAADSVAAELVYVSTNYVFSGTKTNPYHEFDDPDPISIYGASKLAGEREVMSAMAQCYVVRTSSVFSSGEGNFVATMRRLMQTSDRISVVNDQTSNPTFTEDLAAAIVKIADGTPHGIYHVTNSETASWHDWAVEIRNFTGVRCNLEPIRADEYARDARPPMNGTMVSLALKDLDIELPTWRDALERCLQQWPE